MAISVTVLVRRYCLQEGLRFREASHERGFLSAVPEVVDSASENLLMKLNGQHMCSK
jgi:hypothetical protein